MSCPENALETSEQDLLLQCLKYLNMYPCDDAEGRRLKERIREWEGKRTTQLIDAAVVSREMELSELRERVRDLEDEIEKAKDEIRELWEYSSTTDHYGEKECSPEFEPIGGFEIGSTFSDHASPEKGYWMEVTEKDTEITWVSCQGVQYPSATMEEPPC